MYLLLASSRNCVTLRMGAGKQIVSLMLRPNKADPTKVDLDTQNKSFDSDYGKGVGQTSGLAFPPRLIEFSIAQEGAWPRLDSW